MFKEFIEEIEQRKWKEPLNKLEEGQNQGLGYAVAVLENKSLKAFNPEIFGFRFDEETKYRKYFLKEIGNKYYELSYIKKDALWSLKLNTPFDNIVLKINSNFEAKIILTSLGVIE